MRLKKACWEPMMSVSDWEDSSICDRPSRQYNCTGRVFFPENHTVINHHFPAWIHSSTPMDAHLLCPFSAFYINIELTNAIPDAPPVAEIFGESCVVLVLNFSTMAPISLNFLSDLMVVDSICWREELRE